MNTLSARCEKFRRWLLTPAGNRLLHSEENLLAPLLRELGGHQLLQISPVNHPLFGQSLAANKAALVFSQPHEKLSHSAMIAEPDAWPVATESVSVLLVHHMLDIVEHPHAFLREAGRVLAPGGYIVCCGFNPWSLWTVARYASHLLRNGNYISTTRLKDWLGLLGFDVRSQQQLFYTRHANIENRLQQLNWPLGGSYVVTLRKSVQCATPVTSLWKKQKAPLVALSSFSRSHFKKTD